MRIDDTSLSRSFDPADSRFNETVTGPLDEALIQSIAADIAHQHGDDEAAQAEAALRSA